MNFQDQDTQQQGKNPFNANVLKGGQVDPRSELYQRSIAGREKLDEMLSRLWSDGKPEADVFMAGVRALTSRDKGYVGAYLDSKNPGRRYQDNEAMAIVDQVMKNLGIGSHPGNRLTREKDEEGKAKRKEENVARGGFGPKQAPGKKAMPVGQQRKEGKRPGTGQPVEGSRREGLGQPETGPRSEWQKTLKDALDGKITAADVVKAFSKEKQSPLSQSPQAQAKRKEKQEARQAKLRQSIAEDKGLRDREAAAGPETEEEFKPTIDGVGIREAFKAFYNKALQRTGLDLKSHVKRLARSREGFSTDLGDIINEIEEKGFKVDPDEFKKAVARSFGVDLDNYPGWDSEIRSEDSPEPAAAPTETAAAPEPSAAGTKEPDAGKLPEKEINDNFLDAFGDYLFDPDSGKTTKTNVNGYIRDVAKNYGVSTQDIVSSIMKDENGARALKRAGFGATSLVRKGDTSPPESEPSPAAAPKPEAPATAPTETAASPAAGLNRTTRRAQGQRGSVPRRGRAQGTGSGGFNITPKELRVVKEKIAKSTPEQIKSELEQGTLFPSGFVTDTADTNPMEGGSAAAPEPDVPYRTAQERGDEPATAAKGKPGQQSLMKMKDGEMTTEARGDLRKGQKPQPTPQKKQTKAETQEIQKRGSEELAKTQETNRKLEAMTQRMANSPAVKSEEMRNWINNDLDRLLKSFTPAEKTEDPWEQDGPEATGIPEPAAQAPASQKALAGQPGPRGLLSPGKEPQAPPPASGRRTKAQGDEIRRRGQETLEQLQRGAATGRRMANSPVAKREDEINRRGEEALREIQNPKKGRRTKAEGDEIRRRGQEALEQIQGEARRGGEVQSRMANSPAATGEAPRTGREADITGRGEEELRSEVYGNIKDRPGMTNREANRILREGGYTQPRRGLDAAARAVTEGMDRHDAAVNKLPKRVRKSVPKFNSAEYQEFAQSIRSMMR